MRAEPVGDRKCIVFTQKGRARQRKNVPAPERAVTFFACLARCTAAKTGPKRARGRAACGPFIRRGAGEAARQGRAR